MQVVKWLKTSTQRRQTRKGLNACFRPDMQKFLALHPGMAEAERATLLRADLKMTAIILNAFSRQGENWAETVTASLQVMEKLRLAEAATLHPIEQQYAARASQFNSVESAFEAQDREGRTLNLTALVARVDRLRNALSNLQRRKLSEVGSVFFWIVVGLILLGVDVALLFKNFLLLVDPSGLEDLVSVLSAVAVTLIVVSLLLLLTHLGLAPLTAKACELILNFQTGRSPVSDESAKPKTHRGALCIMLGSSALSFLVSSIVARLRADLVIEGSGSLFIVLNTLGLPILNLFIHWCFIAANSHAKSYRAWKDQYLEAVTPLREAERMLARAEIQRRKALPIVRDMERIEKNYETKVRSAYQRLAHHPSLRSEINRLTELLISPTANMNGPSNNDDPDRGGPGSGDPDGDDAVLVAENSLSGGVHTNGSTAKVSATTSPTRKGGGTVKSSVLLSVVALSCLVSGCSPRRKAQYTVALLDNTAEFLLSPGAPAAWDDALSRVKHDLPQMPVGSEVEVFRIADTQNYTPMCEVSWLKDKKDGRVLVSAGDRKRHVLELDSDLNTLLSLMRARPVTVQTRLVESIYEILRSLGNRTTASSEKLLVIASDMEPYTPPQLTASRIIGSDADLKRCLQKVEDNYPPLGPGAPRVVVIYSPSVDMLRLSPLCMERLKSYWMGFFTHIGCTVEWTSPHPKVASSPPTPHS